MTERAVAQLRVATLDDTHALASMHVASWRETYTGPLPDKMLSSRSVEARRTRRNDVSTPESHLKWPKAAQRR